MSRSIVVIGGGASGFMAAITAARLGAAVTILEQNSRPGKKLLSTGNGKCNLTNIAEEPGCYRSSTPEFVPQVLAGFDVQQTIRFFMELGIYTRNRNGYLYPRSEQAASVVEVLEMEARHLKIKVKTREKVQEVLPTGRGFSVRTQTWEYPCDKVILASGSRASVIEGSCGSGYGLAESLGHTIIKPLPALTGLKGKASFYGKWAGVRTEARVTLAIHDIRLKQETGEVQLTDYGISGIPVFQLSRYAARALEEGCSVSVFLDFLPEFDPDSLTAFLKGRMVRNPYKTLRESLVGLFPAKLIDVLAAEADTIEDVAGRIHDFEVPVREPMPFSHAQVCSGGVSCGEINPMTMESKLIPGLYFAGEITDVDGACGGYNLQWAWSSGAVAGTAAAKEMP